MVALQVRDVPDDVRRALAERAVQRGQSLQAFLLGLLTEEARRSSNLALLDSVRGRTDGSRVSAADVREEIDQVRGGREA